MYLEPLAALLSKKCGGRPVQVRMNNQEVLEATGPTSATRSWSTTSIRATMSILPVTE